MAYNEEVLNQEPTLQANTLFLYLFIWVNLAREVFTQLNNYRIWEPASPRF